MMTRGTLEGGSAGPWRVTSGEQAPETVNRLLRSLPGWFGIESSIIGYVAKAHELPTYLAWPVGGPADPVIGPADPVTEQQPVGVLLAARHFPGAAEIYLLAVHPARHRQGAGRALVEALADDLIAEGVELLEVKTLGPSHPDSGYDGTREFYARMGFRPLEEIHGLWPGNPCLIMVKLLAPSPAAEKNG